MDHNHIPQDNTLISLILAITTGTLGFISVNFGEFLSSIDSVLSPVVKLCSIASFIIMVILNWKKIKGVLNKLKN